MKKISTILGLALALLSQENHALTTSIGNSEFGRIANMIYDANIENKIFATTLLNHIVVSNDNGATWEVFYSLPYDLGFQIKQLKLTSDGRALSFVAKPSTISPDKIVVLNLADKTIAKTVTLPNAIDNPYVVSYDFKQDDLNTLIVSTTWFVGTTPFGKVFVTNDNSSSWKEVYYTEENEKIFVNNAVFNPNNANEIFLLRAFNNNSKAGLLTSTNQGTTWEESFVNKTFSAITFNPNDSNDVYIGTQIMNSHTDEGLYNSKNGGKTWDLVQISWDPDGIQNNILSININPKNTNHIIVFEENEVATSFDNGTTWDKTTYPVDNINEYYSAETATINPFNNDQVLASGNYKAIVLKDGGKTFDKLIKIPFFGSLGNVGITKFNNKKHLYYPIQFGWVHKDLDTNIEQNYNVKPLTYFGSDPYTTQVYDKQVENRVFNYSNGMMGKTLTVSDNHGASPKTISYVYADSLADVATDPTNHNNIWVSYILRNEAAIPFSEVYKINISDPDSPIEQLVTLPTNTDVKTILFPNKTNSNEVLIATSSAIYKTIDGGENWQQHNETPIFDGINKLVQNPLNLSEFALATFGGIFLSTDNGLTWEQKYNSEVSNVFFSDVQNRKMIATNNSNEVSNFSLVFSENGNDWTKVKDYLTDYVHNASTDVEFNENSATIYIATYDLGIITYTLPFESLGTNNPELLKHNVTIYPNPTADVLHIKSDKKIHNISITSLSGVLLKTSSRKEINIADLPTGIYIVTITQTDKTIVTKKVIKK